ncbi:unnamed protein product [Nippostrongylus brasiliensis]|uniref:Receptor protein-tyrosine kinase n=1 Tax=Nippostrongylus brasiliensis TaxID=27835 RepID=A0A158R0I9_NIPBR|nr:unnamed protein product [Nippostrongylus brasiliensis]
MTSGEIRDDQLSASSSFDTESTGPQHARARTHTGSGAWCPLHQVNITHKEWIQITFGKDTVVSAVEVQGRYDEGRGMEFARAFKIEYWRPKLKGWAMYKSEEGVEVISGNRDTKTVELRKLDAGIVVRRIRIVPLSNSTRTVCLRLELYGCAYEDDLLSYSAPIGSITEEGRFVDITYDGHVSDGTAVGGLGQLSDGIVGEDPEHWPHRWVGWRKPVDAGGYVNLLFAFSKARNFTSISLHAGHSFALKAQVRIYYPPDSSWLLLSEVQFDSTAAHLDFIHFDSDDEHSDGITYYSVDETDVERRVSTLALLGLLALSVVFPVAVFINPLSSVVKYSDYGEVYCTTLPEINRNQLVFIEKIGQGEFGEVHRCLLESRQVAVKRLHSTSQDDEIAFLREIRVLGNLKHPNVVEVIGVSTIDKPMICIMEYMANGDLKSSMSKMEDVDSVYCISVATQLAAGLAYLESCNFVHRDIAARNCLVDEEGNVKIADFGMARSLYSNDYYRVEGQFVLPIRWMAWESLLLGKFSTHSDVWAFGVTLWEIFTRCREKPFASLTDNQVLENVQHMNATSSLKYQLERPALCPEWVFTNVVLPCWQYMPQSRPSFETLHHQLQMLIHTEMT